MSEKVTEAMEHLRHIVQKRIEEYDLRHRRRFRKRNLGGLVRSKDPRLSTTIRSAEALETTVGDLLGEPPLGEADLKQLREHVDFLIKRFDLMRLPASPGGQATIDVNEEDFVEREFDYPRPHHVFVVQHAEAEAGPGLEADRDIQMTEVLHSIRDVYNGNLRVIRVNGESMSPLLHDGDKITFDTRLITPHDGDVVAVYEAGPGGIVGYWRRDANGDVHLEKENPSFAPVRLQADGPWKIWGTVTRLVERVVRPHRRTLG